MWALVNWLRFWFPSHDPTDVANTRMRCLTKCLAMYGLCHYIYAGEDVPPEAGPEAKPAPKAKTPPAAKEKPEPQPIHKGPHGLEGQLEELIADSGDWDLEFCQNICKLILEFAEVTQLSGLKSLHVENKETLEKVKNLQPDVHSEYVKRMKEIRSKKTQEEEDNGI